MKTFHVTQRKLITRTYCVRAEDEDDAFDVVQSGDGVIIDTEEENSVDIDEWEAEEVRHNA